MQVILLETLNKLGNAGEVVTVKDGYAKNFLFPQKKALIANKKNKADLEKKMSQINENHQNKIDEASQFHKKLEGKLITIEIESNEEGNLYGNVNQKVIIDEIAKTYNVHLSADNLILSPIKNLGNHDFSVRLYDNLIANMQIQILNKSK